MNLKLKLVIVLFPVSWFTQCLTLNHSEYGIVGRGDFSGRVVDANTVEGIDCGYRLFLPPLPFGQRNLKQAMDDAFERIPEQANALGNVQIKSRYRLYFPIVQSCFVVRGTPVRTGDLHTRAAQR